METANPSYSATVESKSASESPDGDIDTSIELPAPEATQSSPVLERVRHHLIPARTSTCVRAPCLKRQASNPVRSSESLLLEHVVAQDRIASSPLPKSVAASADLIESVSHPRHVHFDEGPPQEFFVLSGERYDRRPIQCTQGGSAFDMSLPPRCHSYDGGEQDSAEGSLPSNGKADVVGGSHEEPAPDVGPIQDATLHDWACIKNGTVVASVGYQPRQQHSGLMACGKSLHTSALSSEQLSSASAPAGSSETETRSTAQVSLPVHGFRSFGGLQSSLGEISTSGANYVEQGEEAHGQEMRAGGRSLSLKTTPTVSPSIKASSPDATPMPSPSLFKVMSVGRHSTQDYFPTGTGIAQHHKEIIDDASAKQDQVNAVASAGHMEILRDTAEVAVNDQGSRDLRGLVVEPAVAEVKTTEDESSVKSATAAIRTMLERRAGDKDSARMSLLHAAASSLPNGVHPNPPALAWPNLLCITSSPLSSRCSSVDPWSVLSSSDGDGDGTDSPSNEASWISSNCTSPDLAPSEQGPDAFSAKMSSRIASAAISDAQTEAKAILQRITGNTSQPPSPTSSNYTSALVLPTLVTPPRMSEDIEMEHSTPKEAHFARIDRSPAFAEASPPTPQWTRTRVSISSRHGGRSSEEISPSEATTPETSRRPSFHSYNHSSYEVSPNLKDRRHLDADLSFELEDDEMHITRLRSPSRDGHVKKPKSSKCKACRLFRRHLKDADSSATASSSGSAQITDAESEAPASVTSSTPSEHPTANLDGLTHISSISMLRSSVRSMSMNDRSLSPSSSSRSRASDRSMSFDSSGRSSSPKIKMGFESMHDRDSSNSPAESSSESPYLLPIGLPSACTCDKKKDKERLKKKIRKERELERERDREWERDQMRGRQKKLFGESFGEEQGTTLSALDGF